jgi:hypothetical protein
MTSRLLAGLTRLMAYLLRSISPEKECPTVFRLVTGHGLAYQVLPWKISLKSRSSRERSVLLIGAKVCRGRSQSRAARSAVRRTRA